MWGMTMGDPVVRVTFFTFYQCGTYEGMMTPGESPADKLTFLPEFMTSPLKDLPTDLAMTL